MAGASLTEGAAWALVRCIPRLTHLRVLRLADASISEAAMTNLVATARRSPAKIATVRISRVSTFRGDGLKEIVQWLGEKGCTLTQLGLDGVAAVGDSVLATALFITERSYLKSQYKSYWCIRVLHRDAVNPTICSQKKLRLWQTLSEQNMRTRSELQTGSSVNSMRLRGCM